MSIVAFLKKLLGSQKPSQPETPLLMQTYTIVMESPITLPVSDQALAEYTSQDYMAVFSDEIKERAEVIQAVLSKYHVTPLMMKGRIVPVTDPSITHPQNIIIECDIPADAPIESLGKKLTEAFQERYPTQF